MRQISALACQRFACRSALVVDVDQRDQLVGRHTHANPADGGNRQRTSCELAKRLGVPLEWVKFLVSASQHGGRKPTLLVAIFQIVPVGAMMDSLIEWRTQLLGETWYMKKGDLCCCLMADDFRKVHGKWSEDLTKHEC